MVQDHFFESWSSGNQVPDPKSQGVPSLHEHGARLCQVYLTTHGKSMGNITEKWFIMAKTMGPMIYTLWETFTKNYGKIHHAIIR